MSRSFAVFILSHGRAGNIKTLAMLERSRYSGDTYIIIDDEDEQRPDYELLYGEQVIVFSKAELDGTFDIGDNRDDRRVVVYARNACHSIAASLGLTHFLVLDDDYTSLMFRFPEDGILGYRVVDDADSLFAHTCDLLDVSGALTVAYAQGGDFIGGLQGTFWSKGLHRKAMNTFFCRTDRPFQFYGRINEDTTMYVVEGMRGRLVLTVADVMVTQTTTQESSGGLTDIYCDMGTYYKSFFSVMYEPSCVKVSSMGAGHDRAHHFVEWSRCTPKILGEQWRKA